VSIPIYSLSQSIDTCTFFRSKTAVYYGVDFTKVKFVDIDAYGFADIEKIRSFSFNHINYLIKDDSAFTNLKYIFKKEIVFYRYKTSYKRNLQTKTEDITTTEIKPLTRQSIDNVISYYPYDSTLSQIGLLLIAQNLVKHSGNNDLDESYTLMVLSVFDTKTHNVIFNLPLKGLYIPPANLAKNVDFEIYWFRAIKDALFNVKMKTLKKKYCPNE
jgi:hypothetical protein